MGNYTNMKNIIVLSYLFAMAIKIYNVQYQTYLEINIEALEKNCLMEDVIRARYFTFFSKTLPESHNSVSMFRCFGYSNSPLC